MADSGWVDGAIRVGAAAASLSGFGALATLTGAAITWTRFHGAHLPADQAVAATPTEELLTVGAVTLATFAVASVVAVLVVYLLDSEGTAGKRNQIGVTVLAIAGTIVAAVLSRPEPWPRLAVAVAIAVLAGPLVLLAAGAGWRGRSGGQGAGLSATLRGAGVATVAGLALWLVTGVSWVAAMTILTAALAGVGLHVAHRTSTKFRWFGVGIFLAIVVYGAVLSTLRTYSEVKLQPVAIARTAAAGGGGLSGFYVTDTSANVLIGYVDRCERNAELRLVRTNTARRGRLVKLPRSSIEAISIGPRVRLQAAEDRGPELLAELYDRLGSGAKLGASASDPCAGEGIVDLTTRPTTPVSQQEALRLANRYRPRLRFDSREPWRPLKIDALMAERGPDGKPRHAICRAETAGKVTKQTDCEPLGGVEDLSDARAPARIIDFDGRRLGGREHHAVSLQACPQPQPELLLDCDRGRSAAIYYNVTQANKRVYVDYWWYLRYNRFADRGLDDVCAQKLKRNVIGCFDHEGDWEGITVATEVGDHDTPAFIGLAAHAGVYRFPVAEIEFGESDRPLIYVAGGSHASYPHPCPSRCRQFARKLGVRLPETKTDGLVGWGSDDDREALAPLPRDWRTFDGRWGSPQCTFRERPCAFELGPKSPANQLRYRRPWCFTGATGVLQCDGVPPMPAGTAPTPAQPG